VSEESVLRVKPNLSTGVLQDLDEFLELTKRVDRDNPDPGDVARLQEWLDTVPELWTVIGDLNHFVHQQLLGSMLGQCSISMAVRKGLETMRQDLDHGHASCLEKMLIDHVLTCWLRLQQVELKNIRVARGSPTMSQGDYWDRRLSAAQRRYLRACETLARVRKLIRRTPVLQVNIAAQGGQQVNVIGSVQAKEQDGPEPLAS
jgi:hypothetical protein